VASSWLVTGRATQPSGKFQISTRKRDDQVVVTVAKDNAAVLRLRLKGLDSFRASNGTVTLAAAVSVQDGKPQMRLWKDGKEGAPLDGKSPLRMDSRIVGGDGKPAKEIPLKDGFFEMALPKAFFEGNPKSITLNWIDFYRN
jgi:hypothetical protein